MPSTQSKRKTFYDMDFQMYNNLMAEDNENQVNRLKKNLATALCQDVTPRQRDMLYLYYNENCTMTQVAERLGVSKSTVSRTIKRGEARLARCLRYGAVSIMRHLEGDSQD